ncbi:MAG TPA: valine--tRNA ligase [Bacteroidales bacterium]|mgnify:CR=1 FL=1|nr:valine--tRNA ligase [Bacteroidales bacterium]
MEIPAKYNAIESEKHWYKYWMEHKLFKSVPDHREPYCIVIPPPNVTGVLHMGHMLNNTLQDVLIRRARMSGKNACWVPGTDHASIATEARVVNKLAKEGINKFEIGREKFLEHAWDWTHKHGGIILEQLKKLGASCDWDRTCFTMDEARYESVIKVFVDLYNKGLIYRGVRMINWDPQAKTAVSDEEVNYTDVKSKLYYVKYYVADDNNKATSDFVVVATTRPETIMGDTAVCVNPNDERYAHLKGKKLVVPMVNRIVPVIFDEYVDPTFGTGALKVTPAHDLADYELGMKHKLEVIDIFNDDGTLNEKAKVFVGEDRFRARELSVKMLEENNLLAKVEDYNNKVGLSERTNAVIEPRLSTQWFLKMKDLSKPALDNVLNNNIKLHPHKFVNTYKHWMENVKDWCISRQLWWGQRIPAYYLPDGDYVVAETAEEALKMAKQKTGNNNLQLSDLTQDEDVLDTWFSSWLWPLSVFDGIRKPNNDEVKYYYPTNDLVTAPEILFFWVARMIIAGYEYAGDKPFRNVYLTGIVRDKQRRKMSKSLGNSPEPLELIEKYSADGVRVGMLLCSPAGNDILYDEALSEQGRNFGNKIWNAFRLVKGWKIDSNIPSPEHSKIAVEWFNNKLNKAIADIDRMYDEYRISEALMAVYKLFWDDFSSWYLEMIKPEYQKPIDAATYKATVDYLEKLLHLLHPFMPFITEEIWQLIDTRKEGESIMISQMPKAQGYNEQLLTDFDVIIEAIAHIRNIRKTRNMSYKDKADLLIRDHNKNYNARFEPVLIKMAGLETVSITSEKVDNTDSFMVLSTEFYLKTGITIDKEAESLKIKEELEYTKGFLASVMKKLSNERFVSGAPAQVVEMEKKKQADAEAKIKALEERLAALN